MRFLRFSCKTMGHDYVISEDDLILTSLITGPPAKSNGVLDLFSALQDISCCYSIEPMGFPNKSSQFPRNLGELFFARFSSFLANVMHLELQVQHRGYATRVSNYSTHPTNSKRFANNLLQQGHNFHLLFPSVDEDILHILIHQFNCSWFC